MTAASLGDLYARNTWSMLARVRVCLHVAHRSNRDTAPQTVTTNALLPLSYILISQGEHVFLVVLTTRFIGRVIAMYSCDLGIAEWKI